MIERIVITCIDGMKNIAAGKGYEYDAPCYNPEQEWEKEKGIV